jgi:predicted regulator of Ras-like GTPase activity (Roadblock/LC7/MglB family)
MWSLIGGAVVLSGIGLVLAAFVKGTSDWTVFLPGLVIGGIGVGMVGPVIPAATLTTVEPDRSGMATGTINTLRHVGVAVGVAGLGAIFQNIATSRAATLLGKTPLSEEARSRLANAVGTGAGTGIADAVPPPLRTAVAAAGRTASADSLSRILLVGGLVALASTLLSTPLVARQPRLALPRQKAPAADVSLRREWSSATETESAVIPDQITPPQPSPATSPHLVSSLGRQARLTDEALGQLIGAGAWPGSAAPAHRAARHRYPPKEGRRELRRQQELADVIHGMRRSLPELRGVMIASMDGHPISHYFPHGAAEQIAAMAAMALGVGGRITERTQPGRLGEAVLQVVSGCLFVFSVEDDGILVMSGPANPDLDLIRIVAQTASETISRVLTRR